MEELRIREEEDIEFEEGVDEGATVDQSLCLVGRFLTDRSIRVPIMKDRMADIWRPGRGVQIDEVEEGLFSFQFFHQLDIQKVLQLGPWSFDKHLLVLGVVQQGMQPQEVLLNHVPFWVQVHGVPTGFMSETVGRSLANFIGEFLEYDVNNTSNFWRPFMRIRVMLDVREPLKRSKRIKKQGCEAKTVTFKYERLEIFCYLCGKIGHTENACEIRFTMGVDDGVRGWGPELRVENRRTNGGGGRSKWLRDGSKGEWVSPTINSGRYFGASNSTGNNVSSMQKDFQKNTNDDGGPATGGGNNEGDKAKHGENNYIRPACFFQAPQLYFPVKAINIGPQFSVDDNAVDDLMGEAETVGLDRKRQRANVPGADPQGYTFSAPVVSFSGDPTGGVSGSLGGAASNEEKNKDFLLVGPGNQAYQDQ